jgi:undecaprenyl diphosphate synthase
MAIPRHIAIIMDGNGRWALDHGLPRAEGHGRGAQTIETIVEAARDRGIKYLTLYAFSEENWKRPEDEVFALMYLLKEFLVTKRAKMIEQGIVFNTIGDISKLPSELQDEISKTKAATKNGKVMTLIVALSYGARQEICRAVNEIIEEGDIPVTPEAITRKLDTGEFPDPDLLIRTSKEYRISNFLLWQLAYTELYFTDILWPDFSPQRLDDAISEYQNRERRFGMTSEQIRSNNSGED